MKFCIPVILSTLLATAFPVQATIQIGAVYCDKGEQAPLDDPSLRGARLAVEEINKAGGIRGEKVELIHIKSDSNADDIKKNVTAALQKNSFAGLVGLSDSDLASEAAHLALKRGFAFVTSGATSPKLPAFLETGYYLACYGDNVQAAAAAEWLRQHKGVKSAAVIYDPSITYDRLLKNYFAKAFRKAGGKITKFVPYTPGKTLIIGPGALKADAVYLATGSARDALPVIRQLRSKGFPGPIVGGDSFDAPYTWILNPAALDVFFTTHAFPSLAPGSASKSSAAAFIKSYKKANGLNPDSFSALGYDATRVLLTAIAQAPDASPKNVRKALAAGVNVNGLTGPIAIQKNHRIPQKPVALVNATQPTNLKFQFTPSVIPPP